MTNTIAFIFASASEKNPTKILSDYDKKIGSYDTYFLCSKEKEKILKKDVDLDLTKLDKYQIICPVGAEALKYVCGMTGITKYNGVFIEKKYIPIIHPKLTIFKPQYQEDIQKAFSMIEKVKKGDIESEKFEKYHKVIDTQEEFKLYLEKIYKSDKLVVDIETTSLSPRKGAVLGIALSTKSHEGIYVTAEVAEIYIEELAQIFKEKTCIFHNSKFDMSFLKYEFGFEFPKFEDTMLLHYCLEETVGTHGLKPLALRFTDLGDYEKELDDYKKTFARKNKIKLEDFNYGMLPVDILAPYACKDADGTFQLYDKFYPLVSGNEKFSKLYEEILKPATTSLAELENNGGPISIDHANDLHDNYEIDIEECINEISMDEAVKRFERIHEKTFNPNSTMQLREVFFNILKLRSTKKTATGAQSTDKEVLAELDHPLSDAILDLREKTKLSNTYIRNILKGLDKDYRLRSSFNVHGTTSGRLSSSGTLNYQNIPRDNKDIKKLFRAREGFQIVQCDLKTAEVYYAAALSKDSFLQRAFIENLDFHSYVAKQIFNLSCRIDEVKTAYPDQRQYAKAITFGIMYQAGPAKVAETANISFPQAKQFISKYFNEASRLKIWIDQSNIFIENNAYIYSYFGRKRRLPESKSPNKGVSKHAVRSGVNFLVQSVASDINVLGVIDTINWIKTNKYDKVMIPFTVVHDSIVAEVQDNYVDEWVTNVQGFLQKPRGIEIPNCPIGVDFEVGPSWGDLNDYKI
tara:strand:+ start:1633 stop:3876 length:2244 start_codon:yes stop_codon:yes gene_type:complete